MIFIAGEGFIHVNWTRKKDIYFYNRNNGISCGNCAVKKREESVWLVAAKLVENVANLQACIPRLQQCVILLKRCGTRDIEALVGKIQMENETIILRTLWCDRWMRGNGVIENSSITCELFFRKICVRLYNANMRVENGRYCSLHKESF